VDPYQVLGLKRNATKAAIKKAYRRRAMETHPDRRGDQTEFKQVNIAYRVLSDDARRTKFNKTGVIDEEQPVNPLTGPMGILSQVFVAVMREFVKNVEVPEHADVIVQMKLCLQNTKGEMEKNLRETEKAKAFIQGSLGRFVTKDADNFLEGMVKAHLVQVDKAIQLAKEQMELNNEASKILKNYTFKFTPKIQQFLGTTATSGWTFKVV
jgi:curved DNA-binding protein CbpA